MNKILRRSITDDDEQQIEQTLHFFDSILDQYLSESDEKSIREISSISTSSTTSSLSSHHKPPPVPPISSSKQHPPTRVRRFTSENNLNQISSPPSSAATKRKLPQLRPLQTTATSTEDLTKLPIRRVQQLSSNGASASLIDLSSIDKSSTRPRFRFVPQINTNQTLKEEPEIEQPFHIKVIPSNDKPVHSPSKPSVTIVKPTVIIPQTPKTIPFNRLSESHIQHHRDGPSAFKPTNSNKKKQTVPQFHQSMINLSTPDTPKQQKTATNGFFYRSQQSYRPTHFIQTHYNQSKYASPVMTRNAIGSHPSNIYNFNQPRRNINRQSASITTYL